MSTTRPVTTMSPPGPPSVPTDGAHATQRADAAAVPLPWTDGVAESTAQNPVRDEIATWMQSLVPPRVDSGDERPASPYDQALLADALSALLAARQAGPHESDGSRGLTQAFTELIDALYLSLTGEVLLGSFPGDLTGWPEGLNPVDHGLGLLLPDADPKLLLRALSLANPPLRVPVVVITRGDADGVDSAKRYGLPPRQALQVAGTYRDGEGVVHLLLTRGDTLSALERHLSVPMALLGEILSHMIIGDGRVEQALRGTDVDYAKLPADSACCRHISASAGLREAPRVFDAALRAGGAKCLTCPYAHDLCQPG